MLSLWFPLLILEEQLNQINLVEVECKRDKNLDTFLEV